MVTTLVPPPPSTSALSPGASTNRLRGRALMVAMVVGLALRLDPSPLLTVGFVFVVVVPLERIFPRHGQRLRRPAVGTDIAYALATAPMQLVGLTIGLIVSAVSLVWVPALLLRPLVTALPPLPRTVLGAVLLDLVVYWAHRFGHEVPFLWRFHRIHHSSPDLDWVSGFRTHPADGALLAPPFVLLLVAGFSAELSGVLLVLQVVTGLFLHANVRWRWRPVQRIVATPEFHHWHHANEPDAHNSNYSGLLPIWDQLFGTYFMSDSSRPSVYGIDESVSAGIVGQLWDPVRGLRSPLRMLRRPRESCREILASLRRGYHQMIAATRRPGRRPISP